MVRAGLVLALWSVLAAAPVAQEAPQASRRTISDIRFHGNYSIPDQELAAIIGVAVGDPLDEETLALIVERLQSHEGVGSVEIRERYRSMTRTDEVVLLILVQERIGTTEKFMFLPVLTWTDEYGISYGARFATIDLMGLDERLSFPLTWGGEKQAAAELTFKLEEQALTRVEAGFGIIRRENPHFEIDDARVRLWGRGVKRWGTFEMVGDLGWTGVDFGTTEAEQVTFGLGARLDTRQDEVLPRNAYYLGAGWDRLQILGGGRSFNRYTLDGRGYKSFIGRSVIATQVYYRGADGRLPDYERPFLGGAATVRGYDAGEFIGDNIVLASAELRVPITPPVPVGVFGLDFFFDTGAVYDHGTSLGKARFHNGIGGGFFLSVAFFGLKVDAAYDLDDSVHFHFSTGFRF